MNALIAREAPLALTDVIHCEVLQGIGEDAKFRGIRDILLAYPILCVRGRETFEHAARIHRACRRRGFATRNTVDCLIAGTCLEAGVDLYQNDRDFGVIAGVKNLRLYHPAKS